MASGVLTDLGGPEGPRRRRSPLTFGRVLILLAIGLAVAVTWMMASRLTVSDRPNELKTTRVILPPPPPPPPPPVPQEKPPEPVPTPVPMDQPLDAPPPETPSADPTPGDNALTAREGAGPSNYGLAGGDGSGARIGGRPGGGGGDGFAAYGELTRAAIQRAAQADPDLRRGQYTIRLAVTVDPEGRVVGVRLRTGTGDARLDARLVQAFTGLQMPQRPPAGLPTMNIELNARRGGRS